MPARPAAGFPSLSAACAALAGAGLASREIAARVGVPTSDVAALVSHGSAKARTVVVPADILDGLAPAAGRRGITVNALVRRALDILADDPALLDNVLNDAADLPPQPRKEPA